MSSRDLRNAVAICLQRSKCVMLDRNTPQECLENPELMKDLPQKCLMQYYEYLECRRGIIDMRKRFRGNGPLTTGKYDAKLEQLSSGRFNPEEELSLLSTEPVLSTTSKSAKE